MFGRANLFVFLDFRSLNKLARGPGVRSFSAGHHIFCSQVEMAMENIGKYSDCRRRRAVICSRVGIGCISIVVLKVLGASGAIL